jgi:hypothetical protein
VAHPQTNGLSLPSSHQYCLLHHYTSIRLTTSINAIMYIVTLSSLPFAAPYAFTAFPCKVFSSAVRSVLVYWDVLVHVALSSA